MNRPIISNKYTVLCQYLGEIRFIHVNLSHDLILYKIRIFLQNSSGGQKLGR